MNWKKINKADKIPPESFLVSDGKYVALKHNSAPFGSFLGNGDISFHNATHYILLKDIPLPKD